jgi:hypothetical protein
LVVSFWFVLCLWPTGQPMSEVILSGEYPDAIMAAPETGQSLGDLKTINTSILLILNLVFLYVLTLNGLARYVQPTTVVPPY